MEISKAGIDLIKEFEGLRLEAYTCPAGIWTIGFGSITINGKPVIEGQTCTEEEAKNALKEHLKTSVYPALKKVKVELNQNQFDALCSFIYNIGSGAFGNSTLLKKLNKKDFVGASEQFGVWNKANGKALKGLTLRREKEKQLFIKQEA